MFWLFCRCADYTGSDSVEFSNFMPVDSKFKLHCGPINNLHVRSAGKFFRMTFRSNKDYDATGFHANYYFTDKITTPPPRRVVKSEANDLPSLLRKFGESNFSNIHWSQKYSLIWAFAVQNSAAFSSCASLQVYTQPYSGYDNLINGKQLISIVLL